MGFPAMDTASGAAQEINTPAEERPGSEAAPSTEPASETQEGARTPPDPEEGDRVLQRAWGEE